MSSKKVLGRGLHALISEAEGVAGADASVARIPIGVIDPNPFQPRREFDEEKLKELAESIKTHGILQPLVVRPAGERFEVIAGERRLRAAKMAGLKDVPVVSMDIDDSSMMQVALVENLQREDLNAIEEAEAYSRLIAEFGLTQEEVAATVGKSRPVIANSLRLLRLPESIRESVSRETITAGHARALLALEGDAQMAAWRAVIQQGLTVRQTEALVERLLHREKPSVQRKQSSHTPNPEYAPLEEGLRTLFGTQVRIFKGKNKGFIQIEFYNDNDLTRILDILAVEK